MFGETGPEGRVFSVGDAVLAACLLDNFGDRRVVHMADGRKQMVLKVVVEPAERPTHQAVAAAEIECYAGLMDRPRIGHAAGIWLG